MKDHPLSPDHKAAINDLICGYKTGAKRRNHIWSLSYEEVSCLFRANCSSCNCAPAGKMKKRSNSRFLYNGIDRIDNSAGYIAGNVQTLCKHCNRAKHNMSQDNFHKYLNNIRLNNIRLNSPVKPFYLMRTEDVSGISGTGVVAVGAILPSKKCILEWIVGEITETIFESIEQIERIHGHGGRTKVILGAPPK